MSQKFDEFQDSPKEVRKARDQAQILRDQLYAEYESLGVEKSRGAEANTAGNNNRRGQGIEALRKAIAAADLAIASIDQAMREMAQAGDDD